MNSENKPLIAIVDYEMGNLFSVQQACRHVGLDPVITKEPVVMRSAVAMILPGVGAFGQAMNTLSKNGLDREIQDFIASGRSFMGICLGFQLLFTGSEEFGDHHGLGIIKGQVRKFPEKIQGKKIKVPQIGWNRIYDPQEGKLWEASVMKGIKDGEYMYFVHSYYPLCDDQDIILSSTNYEGVEYCSSIHSKNIFACQFHPEKSGREGMKIYRDWADQVKNCNH
jgi:imidazole glycerol-phosphate synthase subunit HisH